MPLASLLIFVFLVILIVAKPQPTALPIEFVSELETEEKDHFTACLLREDGNLMLLDIEKKSDENIYLYALKIYDHYRNSLPLKYQSPLKGNFEVKKLEKKGKDLEIELEFLYLEENFKLFLTALMWTYQNLGIENVHLKIGKENFHLKRDEIINPKIESTNPSKSVAQIIYYHEEEGVLPVTYLHEEDMTYFLLKKFIDPIPEATFTFENNSGLLIVNIVDPRHEVDLPLIDSIGFNLEKLGLYEDIVIVKNGLLVYNN